MTPVLAHADVGAAPRLEQTLDRNAHRRRPIRGPRVGLLDDHSNRVSGSGRRASDRREARPAARRGLDDAEFPGSQYNVDALRDS